MYRLKQALEIFSSLRNTSKITDSAASRNSVLSPATTTFSSSHLRHCGLMPQNCHPCPLSIIMNGIKVFALKPVLLRIKVFFLVQNTYEYFKVITVRYDIPAILRSGISRRNEQDKKNETTYCLHSENVGKCSEIFPEHFPTI